MGPCADLGRYTFKNRYLLRLSLTQQCAAAATNNRILAWLGDAVLQLVLTEQVLGAVQGSLTATPLGVLDRLRATLVSRAAFQQSARQVDLASYVIMSRNTRGGFACRVQGMILSTLDA